MKKKLFSLYALLFCSVSVFISGPAVVSAASAISADEKIEAQNEDQDPKVRLITGFEELPASLRRIDIDRLEYNSPDELTEAMPKTLKAFFEDGGSEDIAVSWYSAAEEFDPQNGFYYQFSPSFDETLYSVINGYDILKDAPYIGVFIHDADTPAPSSAPVYGDSEEAAADTAADSAAAEEITPDAYTSNSNEEIIFKYLISEIGLNNAAACGVLANIYCESGFREDALGDNGTSYGICQWHNTRFENLKNYCYSSGYDWQSLDGQLHFLEYELNGSHAYVMNKITPVSNDRDGAWDAGYNWCYYFEIPANREANSIKRGNLAADTFWPLYENYKLVTVTLKLSQDYMYLLAGGEPVALSASLSPDGAGECSVKYTSDDGSKGIARVSKKGVVTPVGKGRMTVTATDTVTGLKAYCQVIVIESSSPVYTEGEETEKTTSGHKQSIGGKEGEFFVKVSYFNAVTYTGKKIKPDKQLNAKTDISSLTDFITKNGLIRNEAVSSEELFTVKYICKKNKEAGTALFYPALVFNKQSAKKAGLTADEILELVSLTGTLNSSLKADKCRFTINPVDITSSENEVRLKLNDAGIKSDKGIVTNVKSLKVKTAQGQSYSLSPDQYKLMLMDLKNSVMILKGKKSFTGTICVTIS